MGVPTAVASGLFVGGGAVRFWEALDAISPFVSSFWGASVGSFLEMCAFIAL